MSMMANIRKNREGRFNGVIITELESFPFGQTTNDYYWLLVALVVVVVVVVTFTGNY